MLGTAKLYLLCGEHGATLLVPEQENCACHILQATSPDSPDSEAVISAISCFPNREIILIADTCAQTVQEINPPKALGKRDRRKVIERRLEQQFPHEIYKGTMIDGERGLLAALGPAECVDGWLAHTENHTASHGRVVLAPLELNDLFLDLLPESKSDWCLQLSYHHASGIRHSIAHNGLLVFTRLVPLSASQPHAHLLDELESTLGYLPRLGYSKQAKLSMIAILPPDLVTHLRVAPSVFTQMRCLTPHEAAQALALDFAPAPECESTDALSLLYLATRKRLCLPLIADTDHAARHQKLIANAGRRIALLLWILALTLLALNSMNIIRGYHTLQDARRDKLKLERSFQTSRESLAQEAQSLELLRQAAERQKLFDKQEPIFFSALPALERTVKDHARLTSFEFKDDVITLTLIPNTQAPIDSVALIKALTHECPACAAIKFQSPTLPDSQTGSSDVSQATLSFRLSQTHETSRGENAP